MPSAGEILRSERVKRNRNLSDLARETCIGTRYLTAIEEDDPKTLPGDFFHRSFIRQYASALQLSESEILEILSKLAPPVEIDPLPLLTLPQHIAEVEQQRKPLARIPTRVATTLLLVVLAGCSGLYALWHRAQERSDTDLQAPPAIVTPAPEPAPAALSPKPAPASAPLDNLPQDNPPQNNPEQIKVDVAATERTWVSLSSQGRTIFSGILSPSQTKNFAFDEKAKLLTGNAAGLDVRMNGRPLGPLGQRGQVRMVLFSQDEFQIVAPRKL